MSNTPQDYISTQEQTIEKLRKELRTTRIFSAISSILMVCILVGGFLVCREVKSYADQAWPLVEKLATVDFVAINDTMKRLEESINAVDWEYMSQQLSDLDVDAINEAIAGLDTEQLTKALTNVNNAVDTLQKLSESLKAFASKFGF